MTLKDKLLNLLEALDNHQQRFGRMPIGEMEVRIPRIDERGDEWGSCYMREVDFGELWYWASQMDLAGCWSIYVTRRSLWSTEQHDPQPLAAAWVDGQLTQARMRRT